MKTRELAYTGILAALIAVCSWISIPTAVPFTLQTFAVFLTLGLLGGRLGTLAVTVYLLLGAVEAGKDGQSHGPQQQIDGHRQGAQPAPQQAQCEKDGKGL